MGYYQKAEICLNGHLISANSSTINHEEFCSSCGKKTITSCPNCNSMIRGWYKMEDVVIFHKKEDFKIPSYCHSCGEPYPWTTNAIKVAELLIAEEEQVSQEEIDKMIEVLSDIIVETPKTQLATVRIKKFISKSSSFVADGLRQFIIDFGCEYVLRSMGMK